MNCHDCDTFDQTDFIDLKQPEEETPGADEGNLADTPGSLEIIRCVSLVVVQPCTALYKHVQLCTIMYNLVQPFTTLYNNVQYCATMYNLVQPFTTLYNHV